MCVYRETGQCDTIMWMAQRHTLRTSGLARDVASSTICWCSVFLLPSVKALRPSCLTHAPRTDEIGTVSKGSAYHVEEEGRSEGRRGSESLPVDAAVATDTLCTPGRLPWLRVNRWRAPCACPLARTSCTRTHQPNQPSMHQAHMHRPHTPHTQCSYDGGVRSNRQKRSSCTSSRQLMPLYLMN